MRRGEVHALLGENGAGKSTLMNVLYGLHQPDEGEILLRGEPVHIGSPREAIGLKIGMVHQHFMLIPVMTVAENVVLASEPTKGALLDRDAAEERVRELSRRFGLRVDPRAYVEDIGVGQQQRVEILRVLHRGADVLILDEPTAVLTAQEIADLFGVLRALTAEGVSIIFITHKLKEVLEIADRVTVLRRGRKVDTVPTEGATEASLAKLMVGRDVLFRLEKPDAEPGEPLLDISGLEALDDRELPALRGLDLQVRAGEIVGLAGVDGNGQSELVECIAGLRRPTGGSVTVGGRRHHRRRRARRARGRASATSPRTATGAASSSTSPWPRTSRCASTSARRRWGLLSPKRMRQMAAPLLEQYDVRGGNPDTPAGSLSGGNQQKCVIARELAEEPQVTIAAQPTRGLDVGAIEFVHRRLIEQRDAGRGVLLVSLELEEIRSLADRDPRHLRGPGRRRVPARHHRGGPRRVHDRRRQAGAAP